MTRFKPASMLVCLLAGFMWTGCGLFYQVGTRYKAERMSDKLKVGETLADVHSRFGEPDLRQYPTNQVEIWSYADKANTNDVTAELFYTSTKEGDSGTFLDLKFVQGKLVTWEEVQHTMPSKERGGFGTGFGSEPIASPNGTHY